jgi:hypothetical protein
MPRGGVNTTNRSGSFREGRRDASAGTLGGAARLRLHRKDPAMPPFDSVSSALRALAQLELRPLRGTGAWDVPHVLHHFAQSVEYSMTGFPVLKPAWFRATAGPLAFALFSWRGRMTHGLDQPIPGAPAIAQGQPLPAAVERATAALQAFERYPGPLMPHFAYGVLDKTAFRRAHLMHLADHWREFQT